MKNVGIMTWYFGANYGAVAQSIALYKTINALGYECKMINYRPANYWRVILSSNLPPKYRRIIHLQSSLTGLRKIRKLTHMSCMEETQKVFNAKDIDNLKLDHIVFGSDAIFNIRHRLYDPIYFGTGISTSKSTYSPSCEYLSPETVLPEQCIQSLEEMKAVSVRDRNTFDLIYKNTNIEPTITVDHTFLYDFKEFQCDLRIKKYILIYSFSDWIDFKNEIKKYAEEKGLLILCVGRNSSWADISFPAASFEEWISAFKNAELVMTDSFHGTVFSLKNQRQLILCGRKDKMAKISSLLNQFDANIEIYEGTDLSRYLEKNRIHYDKSCELMEDERQKSLSYLRSSLV